MLILVLAGTGILAGIVSTVASLASLVSYPALLALGLPPVSANVTNTVALVFVRGRLVGGSQPELAGQGRRVARFGLLTAAGGAAGAALLLATPSRWFAYVAPALVAAGAMAIFRPPRPPTSPVRSDPPVPADPAGREPRGQPGCSPLVFASPSTSATSARPAASCCSPSSSGSSPSRWPGPTR